MSREPTTDPRTIAEALAPAMGAMRRLADALRPVERAIAARMPPKPVLPTPRTVSMTVAPKPRASRAPRRQARPATVRKVSTGDPDPGRPRATRENHPLETDERAARAMGGRMPGLRHIGDILADLLPRIAAGWVRP
jgi:hypothetical protein